MKIACVYWNDIAYFEGGTGGLSEKEVKESDLARCQTYGVLLDEGDPVRIATTFFDDEGDRMYKGVVLIPRGVITKIIELKGGKSERSN